MARSLARNTRLMVSTLPMDGTTPFNIGNADATNTFEVKVLDGYNFSQDNATQEIGVNEAGSSPVRGTLSFNTALNPVDVSFSTYVRPYDDGGNANCVENILWQSAISSTLGAGVLQGTPSISFNLNDSNVNELLTLTLFFILENTTYVVEQFNVASAEVDFSIDDIARINWAGNGSRVNENQEVHDWLKTDGTFQPGTDYKVVPPTITTTFLRNKLSAITLYDNKAAAAPLTDTISAIDVTSKIITLQTNTMTAGAYVGGRVRNTELAPDQWRTIIANDASTITVDEAVEGLPGYADWSTTEAISLYTAAQHAEVTYSIAITGATLTLENNFTYLTPEELAIVNLPLAGFAGNRAISGSLTAYLDTGADGTGGLLQDLLAKIEEVNNDYNLVFHMGGLSTDTPRVDFVMPHAQISVPTTSVEDIISTEISFAAKPWDTSTDEGSFEATNELTVTYYKP